MLISHVNITISSCLSTYSRKLRQCLVQDYHSTRQWRSLCINEPTYINQPNPRNSAPFPRHVTCSTMSRKEIPASTDDNSNWYGAVLAGSLALLASSIYASTSAKSGGAGFSVHVAATTILYFTALTLLSFSAAEQWKLKERPRPQRATKQPSVPSSPRTTVVLATRVTGTIASVYTLVLPMLCPTGSHPLVIMGLRIGCFFYACKLLDLTLVRAHKPPMPRDAAPPTTRAAHARYVWSALTETRYASFDMAIDESRRPQSVPVTTRFWTWAPPLLLPAALALFPQCVELILLNGLLAIHLGLEGVHCVLHRRCPHWLFWQPFAARSVTEFWNERWHKGASTILKSLGYVPASRVLGRCFGRNVGRAAGVLSAFSLSGIWHGWCAAALTRKEDAWAVALGLWAVFVLQGVGVLVESWLLSDDKWRRGWRSAMVRVLAWVYSVGTASSLLRYALPRQNTWYEDL